MGSSIKYFKIISILFIVCGIILLKSNINKAKLLLSIGIICIIIHTSKYLEKEKYVLDSKPITCINVDPILESKSRSRLLDLQQYLINAYNALSLSQKISNKPDYDIIINNIKQINDNYKIVNNIGTINNLPICFDTCSTINSINKVKADYNYNNRECSCPNFPISTFPVLENNLVKCQIIDWEEVAKFPEYYISNRYLKILNKPSFLRVLSDDSVILSSDFNLGDDCLWSTIFYNNTNDIIYVNKKTRKYLYIDNNKQLKVKFFTEGASDFNKCFWISYVLPANVSMFSNKNYDRLIVNDNSIIEISQSCDLNTKEYENGKCLWEGIIPNTYIPTSPTPIPTLPPVTLPPITIPPIIPDWNINPNQTGGNVCMIL